MAKLSLLLSVSIMVITIPMIQGNLTQEPEAVENWFQKLASKKEKVTKLHFYFHDKTTGINQTSFPVAQSNIIFTTSPSIFGLVTMCDDLLTVGPDPSSKIVGRAQGFFGSADLSEIKYLMNINLVFTQGKYKGSTLGLHGWNPIFHKYREMSIVGGSGVFRLARGIATAKTFSVEGTSAIVEYHVVIIHY